MLTGSLAILSEAVHSGLDMLAALLTYFAVRAGERPAEAHRFGHAKIESVSAIIETGLLFLASAWIIREAVGWLLGGTHEVESNWYAVGVIVLSIVVDFSLLAGTGAEASRGRAGASAIVRTQGDRRGEHAGRGGGAVRRVRGGEWMTSREDRKG